VAAAFPWPSRRSRRAGSRSTELEPVAGGEEEKEEEEEEAARLVRRRDEPDEMTGGEAKLTNGDKIDTRPIPADNAAHRVAGESTAERLDERAGTEEHRSRRRLAVTRHRPRPDRTGGQRPGRRRPSPARSRRQLTALTAREHQVAAAIGQGHSNTEICASHT
jgi:ATP/maltotriose-dependent transcriptional regulator MalT